MIFGVLIAVIPTFARRRGLRVPGPSRVALAARAGQRSQRHLGGQGTKTTHSNGEDLPGWLRAGADRRTPVRSG